MGLNPKRSRVEFSLQEQEQGLKRSRGNADLSTAGKQQFSFWRDPAPASSDDDMLDRAYCVQGHGTWSTAGIRQHASYHGKELRTQAITCKVPEHCVNTADMQSVNANIMVNHGAQYSEFHISPDGAIFS